MDVKRVQLLDHLARIYLNGLLPEVVLTGGFTCQAVDEAHTLMVVAEGVDVGGALPEPIGVLDLELLISALAAADGEGAAVSFREGRMTVEAGTSTFSLVTAAPENIRTRVSDEQLEIIRGMLPADAVPQPLPDGFAESALGVLGVLSRADAVSVSVGPNGAALRVGRGTENTGAVAVPGVTYPEEYTVALSAKAVRAVLARLGSDATVVMGGPESVVVFHSGPYTYFLSYLADEE